MFEGLQFLLRVTAFLFLFSSMALILFGVVAVLIGVFVNVATEEDTCDEED